MAHKTMDAYIQSHPPKVKILLQKIRRLIKKQVPAATETMSYGIPTFDLDGKHLVHFAAFKHHIGFYPTASGISAFKNELIRYKHARGSVQFPLDAPIPFQLILKITQFRVKDLL